jgi:CRISPR/Cas system-associated exonuclease Cas4 (RecB family)
VTALVERPDLSTRTALSKSALSIFDLCQTKSWFSIHDPKPFVPNEKVTFGSAVDAGVEVILKYARMGESVDLDVASLAAEFVIERDDTPVDILDVQTALATFVTTVQPKFDWAMCGLQSHLTATLEGLGECDGHPDIILADNTILDVKTSARFKEVPSLELGFYALLAEEVDPTRKVPKVGYLNYIRAKKPYWQIAEALVTEELRRWAYEKSAAYVRARKADAALNARADTPLNFSMGGSAKFPSLCADCPYAPANGGPCLVSLNEPTLEIADVA